jgi:3-phosphoshikimate 1-carboxyvinyltransferase
VLTGDASLRRRPVARVIGPLGKLGAVLSARAGDTLPPVVVRGARLVGTRVELPVASAQVKTAVLLAGLFAHGETTVVEPAPTRDHTERMLREMGIRIRVEKTAVTVAPGRPAGLSVDVPGDLSSAAFFLAGAACVPGSAVTVREVGVNPGRAGLLEALEAMGAEVRVEAERTSGGEPVADVTVRHRPLRAVELSGALIPRLIDELPVLMVAATQATGRTILRDAAELRVKESDRLATMARWLTAAGAQISLRDDGCEIVGPTPLRTASVRTRLDHRIAMSAAIAQLCAGGAPLELDDASPVETSFPTFFSLLDGLCGGAA